tara:strand:- start:48 stop:338 length:291 start_codon:yes stop_codon:yes gene_type:complete
VSKKTLNTPKPATKERFLEDLKETFPDKKIALAPIKIKGSKQYKETLVVDDNKMPTCWSPPLEKIETEDSYKALLDYCIRGIKENKWKKEVKNGKK